MKMKERFLRSMGHEETDRVATHDNISSSSILRHYGGDLYERDLMLAGRAACIKLGIDALRFVMPTEGISDEGEVIESDRGRVHKRFYYTTWVVKREIETIEDFYERPVEKVDEDEIARRAESAVRHYRETQEKIDPVYYLYHNGNWVPGLGEYAQSRLGLMLFSKVLYSEKRRVERDMRNIGEAHVRFAKICAENEIAPVIFGGEDVCTDHGTFARPKVLHRFFFPYLRRIIKAFRKKDIKYVFHSDGDLWPILDDLLDCGIAGVHPLEPFCGMDMLKVKEKIGDDVVLFGNIDCSATLPLGTVSDVTREVMDRIADAGPGGGYVLGSSSEIEEIVPLDNVEAMFRTVRRYGKFPKAG